MGANIFGHMTETIGLKNFPIYILIYLFISNGIAVTFKTSAGDVGWCLLYRTIQDYSISLETSEYRGQLFLFHYIESPFSITSPSIALIKPFTTIKAISIIKQKTSN